MSIRGSLDDVPLTDILQLVSSSGKTGAFTIQSASQSGEIYVREGVLIHAKLGKQRGEEAVCRLATWREAQFVFIEDRTTEENSIQQPTASLLITAAQRLAEWRVLSQHIPSPEMIPRLSDAGWATSSSFSSQEWALICSFDNRRSIDEISITLGLSSFETCKILYGLVARGLVELEDPTWRRRDTLR